MNATRQMALQLAGHLCVALGVIGIFLPLLPTTPFLLLAAACYVRSSERHYAWLISNPVFGPPIRDYQQKRAVRPRTKVIALAFVWVSMLFSIYRVQKPALDVVLFCLGLFLSVMILRVRTLREETIVSS
jgi:uncharacterized membrane protein YbaN (DUF454 family)